MMIDMGHKVENYDETIAPSGKKDKMMYPSIHLSHNILEELNKKNVGDMCRLEIMGKIVSKSENDSGKEMTIEIRKMGYSGKGESSKDEYDKMTSEDKDKEDEADVMEKNED